MGVIGKPRSFFKKFKFLVEIDGYAYAGFQKCSALEAEVAKVQQWEGGALVADTSPGRVTISDITLERGATEDEDSFTWFKQVVKMAANTGLVDDEYKRQMDIVQQDRDGSELRRWTCHKAWPCKFVAGDWDNTADENVIESITINFKFFDKAGVSG